MDSCTQIVRQHKKKTLSTVLPLYLPVSQSYNDPASIHILHPASCGWHWRWVSQTVLTDLKQQSNSHRHKTAVCPERHIIPKDTTKSTMFVDRKRGGGGKDRTRLTFSSFLLFQCGLFCLRVATWVMINTVRHGKILAVTMEGVVLVHKPSVSPVSASQAHLAVPWESAAGIQEIKKITT